MTRPCAFGASSEVTVFAQVICPKDGDGECGAISMSRVPKVTDGSGAGLRGHGTRLSAVSSVSAVTARPTEARGSVSNPSAIKPGRTDGRTGAFAWRIDVAPAEFAATARATVPKSAPARDGADASSGFAQRAADAERAPASWQAYRVAVTIQAPTGHRHSIDTIKIGPAQASER